MKVFLAFISSVFSTPGYCVEVCPLMGYRPNNKQIRLRSDRKATLCSINIKTGAERELVTGSIHSFQQAGGW
jgi:hypothetical protein